MSNDADEYDIITMRNGNHEIWRRSSPVKEYEWIRTVAAWHNPTPEENSQYYVSECPDTKQQFLCIAGQDGNIIELTKANACLIGEL